MTEYTTLGNLISPAKVIRCGNGSYPVLSMTMHDGIVLQSDRFKKSLASADQSDYKVVKYGQLVVGFPIDEGVLYIQKATDEGIMSPAYNVWDVDTSKIEANYLELCLHSPQAMQYYSDKLRGSTARRRSIPTADLLAMPIRLPTLKEQREKLDLITKMDALIEERHQQLDLSDQLVKSRFIEMFGDINAPSKWIKKPWAELVTIQNGRDYKHIAVESGGYAVYGTGGEMARASDYLCPENTIIVGRKGTINNPLLVKKKFWNVDTAFGVIVGEQLHYQYFYGFCRMFDFSTLNKQAVLPSTTKADLLKIQIAVPPMELQEQFATFVEQVDKSKFYIQQIDEIYLLIIKTLSWRVKHDYN